MKLTDSTPQHYRVLDLAEPSRSPESILNTVQYYQRKAEGNAKLRRLLQRLRAKRSQTREA